MDGAFLEKNWALIAGISLAFFVAAIVLAATFRKSSYGQLRKVRANLKTALKERETAIAKTKKDEKRVQKLGARIDSTKPRIMQEAKESLEDSRALEKIASDKVMIAENHVRRVIHEEYPPTRQQKMREKYLPSGKADDKPF